MHKLSVFISALLMLIGIFLFTDPKKVSLVLLLVPFILVGILVFMSLSFVLQKSYDTTSKSTLFIKMIPLSITFLVIALLFLASLGQLTIKDSVLVLGFTLLFIIYVIRADFLK